MNTPHITRNASRQPPWFRMLVLGVLLIALAGGMALSSWPIAYTTPGAANPSEGVVLADTARERIAAFKQAQAEARDLIVVADPGERNVPTDTARERIAAFKQAQAEARDPIVVAMPDYRWEQYLAFKDVQAEAHDPMVVADK